MKKLMILSAVAVAALSLAACKHDAPTENVSVANETALPTDAPDNGQATAEETQLNSTGVDNATAIDTASNATAK